MYTSISLGQMDVVAGDPAANLAKAEYMAEQAAARRARFLVLPELWSTGYDLENAAHHATALDEGLFAEMGRLAAKHNLHVIGSCLSRIGEDQYANTAAVFDPEGQLLGSYSKIHLFRLMNEEQYLTAGNRLTLVDTERGRIGLAICYDLRFPEMFRALALAGAQIVFIPAEWPHPRLAHWRTLLRARAIENQFYIVACNRVGQSGDTHFFGHSCIIDPWGETIIEGDEQERLLTDSVQLAEVERIREQIPVFQDRRPELYGPPSEPVSP